MLLQIWYIFYCLWLDIWSRDLDSDFILNDCIFQWVKLTKNADSDNYIYTGYRIGFDFVQNFHYMMEAWVEMSLIFGVDMTSSVHINRDILIFGSRIHSLILVALDDTALTA